MKSRKIAAMLTTLFLLSSTSVANAATINYTVKAGDSLWSISQFYKTTTSKIASINNLDTSIYIYPGQALKVDDNRSYNYTVAAGDTLWKLSLKFNTTVDSIMKANNLTVSTIYIGQGLYIPSFDNSSSQVKTTNYKTAAGDNLWTIAEKFNTSMEAIEKSNMLASNILMPGQILTVPVNSTQIVKPQGITMIRKKTNDNYGDLYDWTNGRRIFTVGQQAKLIDLENPELWFNIKYYGGSNHADIVPLHYTDTNRMKLLFNNWSWNNKRPMILKFTQGGTQYQLAVSLTGMPHGTTDIYDNGVNGHFDMYFYNSTSHVSNETSSAHQKSVLTANGQ
ncbi:LysM peptidoglycan-binding domain-containing protein [Clostridium aestuarii]|uniref:LysM peptidoglycan-binding domain-containing protein n=1 Tax=Clostridium aestuarii TaxID=338193 RepID=A0ABT4D097_9CLOT|nr:LysM peptidoglycan-binding domain-containing protein [Clostridium aestuarii]MCY6484651.1 LysM peptidoglycan-binding domain-containing protein [Clostridium aestuarii]